MRFTNSMTTSWSEYQLFRCCTPEGCTKEKWPSHSFCLAAKLGLNSVFSCYAMECFHMFLLVYVIMWVQLGFWGQFVFWYHEFTPILHTRHRFLNTRSIAIEPVPLAGNRSIFRRGRKKWRKATISFVVSICPSVRPNGSTRLPLDDF
jgi:hypothetical protein